MGGREEPASGRLKGTFGAGTTHQIIQIHCKSRSRQPGWHRTPIKWVRSTAAEKTAGSGWRRGRRNGGGGGPQATADDKD